MRATLVIAIFFCIASEIFYITVRAQDRTAQRTSVWDGVYSKEQADRGQNSYGQNCARCHGPELAGSDEVPGLVGGQFLSNWNGLTVGDLFDRMYKSMPADSPGSVNRQTDADILAYVLSANGFPAGNNALARQSEILATIQIDATKPAR